MDDWVCFELLYKRGVSARIEAPYLMPAIDGPFVVKVPVDLTHRARLIVPESSFDESELACLATGRLDPE